MNTLPLAMVNNNLICLQIDRSRPPLQLLPVIPFQPCPGIGGREMAGQV